MGIMELEGYEQKAGGSALANSRQTGRWMEKKQPAAPIDSFLGKMEALLNPKRCEFIHTAFECSSGHIFVSVDEPTKSNK